MKMMSTRRLKTLLFACCCLAALFTPRSGGVRAVQAEYAGNEACAKCHASIARSYAATPMARTSGAVSADIVEGRFRHEPSGIEYRVRREGGAAFLEYERKAGEALKGRQQLHYFIGSNAAGRSYLFAIDRYLFQSPATYYSQSRRWDASPGYESDREMSLNRPIDANCLFCHASQTQAVYGARNRFLDPPFKHNGISCERCHGPGSLHAQGTGKIVNPAKLDPARRDAVCAQCHLSGEARVELPGRKLALYRPGDRLADYVSYFVFEGAGDAGLKVNSHVENMAQSLCRERSGERMSCLSCHNPHSVPAARESAAYFRGKCLACHQLDALPANERHHSRADCAACHMPKAKTVDGGHGVLTDHSIPRLQAGKREATLAGRKLAAFAGYSSDERSLGLAYAEVALGAGEAFHGQEAYRLLNVAAAQHTRDAELFTRLAYILEIRGEAERALKLYQSALRWEPHRVVAAVNAGRLYASKRDYERAAALWQDALNRNPGLGEAAVNLAIIFRGQGEWEKARDVLRQALRFNPDFGAARQLLRETENQMRGKD